MSTLSGARPRGGARPIDGGKQVGAGRRGGPRARLARAWDARTRWRLGRSRSAALVGLAVVLLSFLGLIYLVEISRVASYGYALSTLQERQAQLDRENELLFYQISQERTLARVDDLARRQYGMQPFVPAAPSATTAGTSGARPVATGTSPRHQFLSVPRPVPTASPAASPPAPRASLLDRLWRRVVGIGVAGDSQP